MGRGKPALSDDARHARARANRRECDSRAAAWHNVLVAMLDALGYALVVQKPSKLRPRATLPRVPCVRVTRRGETVYDMHRNVGRFNEHVVRGEASELARKGFHANEKSVVFNVLVEELEAACAAPGVCGAVAVRRSARQPARDGHGRRCEARHRVERVDFFGHVLTNDNVVACGRRVYEFCCREFRGTPKETDVAMARFPLDLWGAPCSVGTPAGVAATPDAASDDALAGAVLCSVFDGRIALDGVSVESEYDGVVTGAGCN